MPAREQGFSALAVVLTLLVGTTVFLTGAAVYGAGLINIHVQEKREEGKNIRVLLPGVLVQLGVRFVPDKQMRRAAEHLRPWLPTLRAATRGLQDVPDGPLVEVSNGREQVSVVKRRGSMVIDVNAKRETVHVSFPVRLVDFVLDEFEKAGKGPFSPRTSG